MVDRDEQFFRNLYEKPCPPKADQDGCQAPALTGQEKKKLFWELYMERVTTFHTSSQIIRLILPHDAERCKAMAVPLLPSPSLQEKDGISATGDDSVNLRSAEYTYPCIRALRGRLSSPGAVSPSLIFREGELKRGELNSYFIINSFLHRPPTLILRRQVRLR